MIELKLIDYIFLYCLVSTWFLLLTNIMLTLYGYKFFVNTEKNKIDILRKMKDFPFVSVLIPAHNEGLVIEETVHSILELNYPNDKYEIIVINDNSNDNSREILEGIKNKFSKRNIVVINTTKENGGRGKSTALNIGYKHSKGEYIVVYDADNTPDRLALRYLVHKITSSNNYGAVIGKFRTRNKRRNILTSFINIETLSFQWMAQAGRWQLFNLCTIPGTNFIIRKNIIEKLHGWDENAIAEDTELSFRVYEMGYIIAFMPLAVTWEQEPERFNVWIKQRTRWVTGNIYVLVKYFKKLFTRRTRKVFIDLYYFFSVYVLFLTSVIISDVIFLLGIFTDIRISISGNYFLLWILAYILFILEVSIALTMEKGEANLKNILLVAVMYFTYCQMWILVAVRGIFLYMHDRIFKHKNKWYKTERF